MKTICETLSAYNLPEECPQNFQIQRLTGDASSRSYFRITAPEGNHLVLMKMPEPFLESQFPYLDQYHLFRSLTVRLAEIYHIVPEKGYVFLQDLGDSTFYELYADWSEPCRIYYYIQAIDLLNKIQGAKPENAISFDTAKFTWELNYFRDNFLFAYRKLTFSQLELEELQIHFARLAEELSDRPRVFTHRDYHSRNLMLHEESIYVIDFQDARFGPTTYDLASLLYDSYIQHSRSVREHLERYFFTFHPDSILQRYEYPRMCLQRNLKALGTFGYQASRLGRNFYVQFMEPTLGYIKEHLQKLPEYAEFGKLLARHLPELR